MLCGESLPKDPVTIAMVGGAVTVAPIASAADAKRVMAETAYNQKALLTYRPFVCHVVGLPGFGYNQFGRQMKLVVSNSKIGRNDPCHCGSGLKYKKCCWEIESTKKLNEPLENETKGEFDPISMRKEMQAMMGQMAQIMEKKGLSVDEANEYFTGRHMDEIANEARGLKRSPKEQAEDFAYQAHSARTPKQAILLAQKAIEIDANCAEAYLVLEEALANDPIESISYYEKAIAAAKKTLGAKFFKENEGHFWGLHETRSFMTAKLQMAQSLWQVRRQSEAIDHCWELLRLNPNDNQGVRYILYDFLLTDNRLEAIEPLLKMFPRDGTAHWEYNTTLLYYKKFGSESEKAKKQARVAFESNQFIEQYLSAKKKIPEGSPSSYSLGSKEEAMCYMQHSAAVWLNTEAAIAWLKSLEIKTTKQKANDHKRTD